MHDFYEVEIDHGDEWLYTTDVLAGSPRLAAWNFLKELAEEDADWCSPEGQKLRVRKDGGQWEHFHMRATTKIMVEDCSE